VIVSGRNPDQGQSEPEEGRGDGPGLDFMTAEPAGMYQDPQRPGMHRTDTIDIGVIVSGEFTTVADDGSKVVLGPGDVYIQNGAIHNWEQPTDPEKAPEIVWVLIGADRDVTGDPLAR
jgi:hypothetical protein